MSQQRLFITAFTLTTMLAGSLCLIFQQPLALGPVPSGAADIFLFILLSVFLSFCLVFITLPVLSYFRSLIKMPQTEEGYYILYTLIILQLVTLLTGYLESSVSRHGSANGFYYYKGVTNSHLWIIAGNATAAVTASLYARKQIRKSEEKKAQQQIHHPGK